jgi:hypothetical protein
MLRKVNIFFTGWTVGFFSEHERVDAEKGIFGAGADQHPGRARGTLSPGAGNRARASEFRRPSSECKKGAMRKIREFAAGNAPGAWYLAALSEG